MDQGIVVILGGLEVLVSDIEVLCEKETYRGHEVQFICFLQVDESHQEWGQRNYVFVFNQVLAFRQ